MPSNELYALHLILAYQLTELLMLKFTEGSAAAQSLYGGW